jgi:hypothetical protein
MDFFNVFKCSMKREIVGLGLLDISGKRMGHKDFGGYSKLVFSSLNLLERSLQILRWHIATKCMSNVTSMPITYFQMLMKT